MFNPTRRNKNIGKTQEGRVKDGVAAEKESRLVFAIDLAAVVRGVREGVCRADGKSVARLLPPVHVLGCANGSFKIATQMHERLTCGYSPKNATP